MLGAHALGPSLNVFPSTSTWKKAKEAQISTNTGCQYRGKHFNSLCHNLGTDGSIFYKLKHISKMISSNSLCCKALLTHPPEMKRKDQHFSLFVIMSYCPIFALNLHLNYKLTQGNEPLLHIALVKRGYWIPIIFSF